jgi:hypothetical protein
LHLVVVAQRFTATMERTAQYLSEAAATVSVYLVELVRFAREDDVRHADDQVSVFEARTVFKPGPTPPQRERTTRDRFLAEFRDPGHREAVEAIFDACDRLELVVFTGTKGVSIRMRITDRAEPLSIAWLHPPGVTGWYGLNDLTLGYDASSAAKTPSVEPVLEWFLDEATRLTGARPVNKGSLHAVQLAAPAMTATKERIVELLDGLVQRVGGDEG